MKHRFAWVSALAISLLAVSAQSATTLAAPGAAVAPRTNSLTATPAGPSAPSSQVLTSRTLGAGGNGYRENASAAAPAARTRTYQASAPSPARRSTPPRTVSTAPQLVRDAGFETGVNNCCWAQSSSGGKHTITTNYDTEIQQLTGTNPDPDGGAWSSDLCGYANCNPDQVWQGITLPANARGGMLSYSIGSRCPIYSGTCAPGSNSAVIKLVAGNNDVIGNIYHLSSGNGFIYAPQGDSLDVSSFISAHPGQSITLYQVANNSGADQAEWFFDQVLLTVTMAPDAPTIGGATSTSPGQASVAFVPPGNEGTSSVSSYTVSTYDSHRNFVQTNTGPSSPVTVTGLTNGQPYFFKVSATNSAGTGPASGGSNSVTPVAGTTPPVRLTAPSTQQYTLPNSDGSTWQVLDETNLSLSLTTTGAEDVLLSANADLWTWNAGYNQDIGIMVNGTLAAWKESGGFAGTFSPNAAFLETVYHLNASTTYSIEVVWKTNKAAIGASVSAGAGPISFAYSPSRLTLRHSAAGYNTAVSTQQYSLSNSNGTEWQPVDDTNLKFQFIAGSTGDMLLSANADLWTWNAGFNQDIGIMVSGGTYPTTAGQPQAWKESGGYAGVFSPNAAFVQTVIHVTSGTTYNVELFWKANKNASGAKISAGAGPINSNFSPTRLTGWMLPADTTGWGSAVTTTQPTLANNDGATWVQMDPTHLTVTLTPGSDEDSLVSGNADLWTSNAGFNQDIAVMVTDNGGSPALLTWKESGGYGGTFSPNAAFVQGAFHMTAAHTYVFSVWWKTNKPGSGSTIWAGAGPIGGAFSPTRLSVVPA